MLALLACSCVSNRSVRYSYDIVTHYPKAIPRHLEIDAIGRADSIELRIANTSSATARIIWDRSAFVGLGGQSSSLVISGQKLAEANKPSSPTVIPAGAKSSLVVVPTDHVEWRDGYALPITGTYVPGRWQNNSILPIAVHGNFAELDTATAALGGKSYSVLLYIEHPTLRQNELLLRFEVESIKRVRCRSKRGQTECDDLGEIYPSMTLSPRPTRPGSGKR